MKKFLSAFLAILMVLTMVATSMVTVFAAEEAEEVHSILISNGEDIAADQTKDVKSHGWRNHNGHEFTMMELDGQKAAAITVKSNASSTTPRFHYYSDTTVDLTKFTYVEFDFYISDLAKMTDGFKPGIELSSAGLQDKAEVAGDVTGVEWKAGWNHVKVALADIKNATPGDAGAFDPTAWNFMRILVGGTGTFKASESDPLILAIDNFGFSDGTETPAEKPAAPVNHSVLVSNGEDINADQSKNGASQTGWRNHKAEISLMELAGQKAAGMTVAAGKPATDLRFHYFANETVDLTKFSYVEFDLYVSDIAAFAGVNHFALELTSISKEDDGNESQFLWDDLSALKTGWNHVKFPLSSFAVTGTFDATKWNFVRLFAADGAAWPQEFVVAIDNFGFSDGTETPSEAPSEAPADVFDDYDAQSVSIPLLTGSKAPGWGLKPDLAIKKAGSSSVAINLAANKNYTGGGDGFIAGYNHDGTVDTTGAATFRFFVYTNDAAVMNNVGVELELTSSGTCDQQENNYAGTLAKFVEGGSFQNGWNEVIIPLSSIGGTAGGGADWTKINFMRMFNQHGAFKTGAEEFMIRFDEFGFYKEDGTLLVALTNCDVESDWEGPTNPTVLDGETVIGNTWAPNQTLGVGWFIFRYGLNFEGKYPEPVDISNMKYIEFDLYVSDAMALINSGFSFELTSIGGSDHSENAYNWDGWRTGLADGWNHIQWPLSWFNATTDGSCDFTALNYLRLFNAKDLVVGENGLTVAMKNVEFTTGKYALELDEYDQPLTEKEVITFTPARGDKTDAANSANKDLVVKISGGDNTEKFFADDGGEIIYKIPVSATKYVKYVTVSMTTGAQLWLQASTDGTNWNTVYEFKDVRNETDPSKISNGMEKGLYTFDLTDAVVGEEGLTGDYIYIRIADSYRGPGNGWGGNLYYSPVTFEIIREALPHQVQLPVVGTKADGWNWATSLNASQGNFSVSTVIPAGKDALGNAAINGYYMVTEGVDTTGTDTFTFDFYISNAEAIKNADINLEITSGGQPDKEEANYVSKRLDTLVEGGVKDGWNTVVLPLANMGDKDKADWTRINCFRLFFMPGVVPGDNDLVVAYDNLRFIGADNKVVVLSDCEPDTNNWHDVSIIEMDGKRVFGKNLKDTFGNYVLHMYYQNPEAPVDISFLKYIEFDIYFTDVDAIKDVVLEVELNSSGDWDKNDLFCRKAIKDYNLVDGWNHVKIALSDMINENGEFDATNLKWLRFFTHTADVAVDEFTFAFTNVRFTDDQAPVIETPANPEPDTPAGPPAADSELSVKDAIALGGSMEHNVYTEGKYYVTGVITEVYNEKYGNMKITDAEGNILTIYGTWSADGSTRYDALETKPVAGDTVTLYGIVGQYNGTPQIKNGWITAHTAAGDEPQPATKEDKYIFEMFTDEEKKYLDPDFQANNANNEVRFADCSAYFIYKYDLKSFRGVQSISFEGNIGGQLHLWASADGKNWVEIEKHEVRFDAKYMNIDLSVMAEAIAQTATLYVKIGDAVTADGNGGQIRKGQVHLTVVYDATADQTPPEKPPVTTEHEKYEFTIGTEEEGKYLLNEGNSVLKTPDHDRRYADTTKYFIYKYDVKNVHQIAAITFKAKAEAQMMLQVSVDKENWITIDLSAHGVKNVGDRLSTAVYKFDITAIAEKLDDAHKTIYVKISDNKTDDGWGGCLVTDTPVVLDIEYTPLTDAEKDALEATKTEHSIPLWGANKTWGDIYVTDNENQVAGSGCISTNLKGISGTHAPSKLFEAVDATGMDTFEFNLYLSDLAIVDHLTNNIGSGSVELCSGGSCDQAEKAVMLKQIFTDFVVGELTVGWNQIAIPLNNMASTPGNSGEFQITGINYIRIFWSNMTNPTDQDWIIKFDNFRMTDRQAEADRIAAEFEARVLEENKGLIANMEALKTVYEGELNADNFASAKAKYSNTKAAFEKLSAEAQEVLKKHQYYQHISKAKKAIEDYEEAQQILKDNAKLIADLEALAAYKDASAFTNENYDAAKAAIEAARAAVDALTKTQKDALATYIAHLTAAEDAMPDTKPPKAPCTEHVDADKDGKCDECDAEVPVEPTDCEHVDADGDKKCDKCGEDMGGCKSALTIGALATMILAGAWVTIAARKKED